MKWSELLPGDCFMFKDNSSPPAIVLEKPRQCQTEPSVLFWKVFCSQTNFVKIQTRWSNQDDIIDDNVVIFKL